VRSVFGAPADAHNLKAQVDSSLCLSCHRNILRVSEIAPRDLPLPVKEVGLVMSHRKHMEAFESGQLGEGCLTCHAGVVHDRPIKGYPIVIPRGHVSADSKPWFPDHPEGSSLQTRALNDCFRCHDGKTEYQGKVVERKCEVCHLPEKLKELLSF
jgi:cytochrome c nitrite reductase small subunit